MRSSIRSDAGWNERDVRIIVLDGEPPPGFDCGRAEQNEYLYARAWQDQQLRLAVTRLVFVKGIFAAFVSTFNDSVELGTREKDRGIRYRNLPALKIGQMAVDLRFSGAGLGGMLLDYTISLARRMGDEVGVRYLILDAKVDAEAWYTRRGFVRNRVVQKRREEARQGEDALPVSMRFDLLRSKSSAGPQ